MKLYADSKLKYSPTFTEPLEKAGWHFRSQLLAPKGQLLHSEGTSQEVTNHKVERSAWGRRLEFFSQRCQCLQGSISQVRRKKGEGSVPGPHLSRRSIDRTSPVGITGFTWRWRKHQREAPHYSLGMAEERSGGGSKGPLPKPSQGRCFGRY